jgi:hypothetical protein
MKLYDMTNIAGNADSMDEIIKQWWTDSVPLEPEMKHGVIIIAQYKGPPTYTKVHKEVVQPAGWHLNPNTQSTKPVV